MRKLACESDKENCTIFTNSFESISNLSKVFAQLSLCILQNYFDYKGPQRSWIRFLRIFKILARFFKVLPKILKDPQGSSVTFEAPTDIFEDLAKESLKISTRTLKILEDLLNSYISLKILQKSFKDLDKNRKSIKVL